MIRSPYARALIVAALLAVAGCSSSGSASPPNSVDDLAVSDSLGKLADRAADANHGLADRADELAALFMECPANRTGEVAAWKATRLAWDDATVYRWGPGTDVNYAPSIDYWPTDPEAIDEAAAGSEPMTQLEYDTLGAAAHGLPAIEVLVFGKGAQTARECSYGQLAAEAVSATADAIGSEFTARRAQLGTGSEAFIEALSTMTNAVYDVCDGQLGMPSGNTAIGGPPVPELLRQGPGFMAAADVRAQMAAMEQSFAETVQPLIAARYADATNPLTDLFRQFDDAFAKVGDDVAMAITERPEELTDAVAVCFEVRRTFSTNVASMLGVTLILPIGDGD